MNNWFTEHCLICGSINHIFVDMDNAHAWECYFCGNKFWLDEIGRDAYVIEEGVDEETAESNLKIGHYSIKFLIGNYEKNG